MQALRTGQLPADLNIGEHDAAATTANAKEDEMVTDEEKETNDGPKDAKPESKNDGPEDMEQVLLVMLDTFVSSLSITFFLWLVNIKWIDVLILP